MKCARTYCAMAHFGNIPTWYLEFACWKVDSELFKESEGGMTTKLYHLHRRNQICDPEWHCICRHLRHRNLYCVLIVSITKKWIDSTCLSQVARRGPKCDQDAPVTCTPLDRHPREVYTTTGCTRPNRCENFTGIARTVSEQWPAKCYERRSDRQRQTLWFL